MLRWVFRTWLRLADFARVGGGGGTEPSMHRTGSTLPFHWVVRKDHNR